MRTGRLRYIVDIFEATGDVDEWNESARAEKLVFPHVPAQVQGTGGAESVWGLQVVATATHLVSAWWFDGVKENQVVVWEGRRLNIEAIIDRDGMRREMVLQCRELKKV